MNSLSTVERNELIISLEGIYKKENDRVLRIEKLKVHGLAPLSFTIEAGACLGVMGASGSGKSILLRAIADLDAADGNVFLDGTERRDLPGPKWRRLVRYVAAEPGWWGETARSHFKDLAAAIEQLPQLDLTEQHMDQLITSLSTGERQRLALIRALADKPKALLFDEPTSALDATSAALVERLIERQLRRGRYVLLVSHDVSLLDRLATSRIDLGAELPTQFEVERPSAEAAKSSEANT